METVTYEVQYRRMDRVADWRVYGGLETDDRQAALEWMRGLRKRYANRQFRVQRVHVVETRTVVAGGEGE